MFAQFFMDYLRYVRDVALHPISHIIVSIMWLGIQVAHLFIHRDSLSNVQITVVISLMICTAAYYLSGLYIWVKANKQPLIQNQGKQRVLISQSLVLYWVGVMPLYIEYDSSNLVSQVLISTIWIVIATSLLTVILYLLPTQQILENPLEDSDE